MYLIYRSFINTFLARLACVRHAASVHPEPGSNSLFKSYIKGSRLYYPLILQTSYPSLGLYAIASIIVLKIQKLTGTSAPLFYQFR